ncbi:MAG: sigma-54-dependent Fis family transcriptional regulator [Cyclobacteriaceae bacterium]|nr:sigma-54-dependent Fis family transcriptional regulator [Cyclobacteriaceae bacterium]
MKSILIVDDDKDICLLLERYLTKKTFDVATVHTGAGAIAHLKDHHVDLVLLDFKLPDYTGIDVLQKIKIVNPGTQVIIITGYSDMRVAIESLKKGAFDYVAKPLYPDEILLTIQNALKTKAPKRKAKPNINPVDTYIIGISPQSQTLQKHIDLIAPTNMSVVLLGETGTGKEYVAREIHLKSTRSEKPFVAVDCGALPTNLVGSELFGHVKGAFTGAIADKKGCFELADGGTLFLDEIGNLTYENQNKLLRVLQDKQVKNVGGIKSTQVDVRLIVATNENLRAAVARGDFREDIFHRLNEFVIELAPLRQRHEDIELFAEHFLRDANLQLDKNIQGFSQETVDAFKNYHWHGNLRELRNVVKRAVLICQERHIQKDNLPLEILQTINHEQESLSIVFNSAVPKDLKTVTEEAERKAIIEVLRKTQNNKSKTAEMLGIDRKTLYNKINAYDIDL